MTPRFRHLLRLTLVLAMAMGRFEPRPLLRTAELFRGYALQVVARRVTGQVLAAPGHQAVLVWSQLNGAPTGRLRHRLTAGLRTPPRWLPRAESDSSCSWPATRC
ncbi:MAG: hypothetical protein NVSMB13_00770 [Mycobacteriales bacterium]